MVDAYVASGNYQAALAEVDRFRQTSPVHPELPFVEARIRFASGDVEPRGGAAPHRARQRGAAGFPALSGHAHGRATTSRRRPTSSPTRATSTTPPRRSTWPIRYGGRCVKHPRPDAAEGDGRILAAGGAGRAVCRGGRSRRVAAAGVAERGRSRPDGAVRRSGRTWPTAAPPPRSGSSPVLRPTAPRIAEYRAMSGESAVEGSSRTARAQPGRLDRRPPGARRAGHAPNEKKWMYANYRRPLAAQAYYLLGDYQTTLRVLQDFEPADASDRRVRLALGDAGPGAAPPRRRLRAARPPGGGAAGVPGRCWRSGAEPTRRCSRSCSRRSRGWRGWGRGRRRSGRLSSARGTRAAYVESPRALRFTAPS